MIPLQKDLLSRIVLEKTYHVASPGAHTGAPLEKTKSGFQSFCFNPPRGGLEEGDFPALLNRPLSYSESPK